MAAESSAAATWPPPNYRLADVRIKVRLVPAHGLPAQALTISGSGSAALERDGHSLPFGLAEKDVFDSVNAFYRIRFFELPERLGPRRSVFLSDDGSLATQLPSMHDATTTTVCFAAAGFEKCVSYQSDPPTELAGLVRHLLTDARERTEGPTPPS